MKPAKPPKAIAFQGQNIYQPLMPQIKALLSEAQAQGFTLAETAIAISSFLLMALYGAEQGNIHAESIAHHPDNPNEQVLIVLRVQKLNSGGKPHAN